MNDMDYIIRSLNNKFTNRESLMAEDQNSSMEMSRDNIIEHHKWNLSDLYKSLEDWKNKKYEHKRVVLINKQPKDLCQKHDNWYDDSQSKSEVSERW